MQVQTQASEGTRCVEGERLKGNQVIQEGDFFIHSALRLAKPCPPLSIGTAAGLHPEVCIRPKTETIAREGELEMFAYCGCDACAARDRETGEYFIITFH